MAVLDERLARKESHPVGLVAKKVRKVGSPSLSLPPPYAPAWSVDPEYNQSEFICPMNSLCPKSFMLFGLLCTDSENSPPQD